MNNGIAIGFSTPVEQLTDSDRERVADAYRAVTGKDTLTTAEVFSALQSSENGVDANGVRVFTSR